MMGGNVHFKEQSEGHPWDKDVSQATPIVISMWNDRCKLRLDIKSKVEDLLRGRAYAFCGSTSHLFDKKISDCDIEEFHPIFGDIDILVDEGSFEFLCDRLGNLRKHSDIVCGNFVVHASLKHGDTMHVLMRRPSSGECHQFDFTKVPFADAYPAYAQEFFEFSHSSDWWDTKNGIKGAHHKILLNACGRTKYKFSIMHGLGFREGEPEWETDLVKIHHKLFRRFPYNIGSFQSLTATIKMCDSKIIFAIINKFTNDLQNKHKNIKGNDKALEWLHKEILA